ncbi:MAG: hypothetical protein QW622_03465 [Candidatus Pacearchaeota archaeon]
MRKKKERAIYDLMKETALGIAWITSLVGLGFISVFILKVLFKFLFIFN